MEANAEQLPFASDTFDVVLVNCLIRHLARPDVVCTEIRPVLTPGGRFIFAAPIEQFGFGPFIEALTTHHTMGVLAHAPFPSQATQQDYEHLVNAAGFARCDVAVHQLTLRLADLEPILQTGWAMWDLEGVMHSERFSIRLWDGYDSIAEPLPE